MACRYVRLALPDAQAQWQQQYEAASQRSEKGSGGKGGWRVRELVLIGGLVLPIWGMVEQALVKQQRPTDRRMHVLRLQTTGWSSSSAGEANYAMCLLTCNARLCTLHWLCLIPQLANKCYFGAALCMCCCLD